MVLAVGVAVVLGAGWWVANSPLFDLRSLRVEGAEHLSFPQVTRLSGLTEETNVLWLSAGTVERRLERNPWILDAVLSRRLPGGVTIKIRERVPTAVTGGPQPMLIAADGMVLGAAPRSVRLPAIAAPTAAVRVGQRLPVSPELAVAAALPLELGRRVAAVAHDPDGSLVLQMRDGTRVLYGNGLDVRAKAEAVRAVLAWAASHGLHPTYVDVRAPSAPALGTTPLSAAKPPARRTALPAGAR
jgi:cell division protein FtsQ